MVNRDKIVQEFERIRNQGFIKSNRAHNTGIGKTFEDHLGVKENNDKAPDFEGFEVKSQRTETDSYLTLFTKSPSGQKGVNKYLRDKYGEFYDEYPLLKKLHTSIFGHKENTYLSRHSFKIVDSPEEKKIIIHIKNLVDGQLIDSTVYWTYQSIEACLKKKLRALFYVKAESKIIEGAEHFHYTHADIYLNPSLEKLIELIKQGKVMIDIRIGSYKTGANTGKTHDHGTGFRIKSRDLPELYEEHIQI